MHANALAAFKTFGLSYVRAGTNVLEIGPADYELRNLLPAVSYSIADLVPRNWPCPSIVMPDEYTLPTPKLYDVVIAANVIEHVRKIWRWVPALAKALKPGGKAIFVSPISWPYHQWPVDCWRLYPEAYKSLFEDSGLEFEFAWYGNLEPIEPERVQEHGAGKPIDCIAVGGKT
jgi:SAM-dependent methyltransferase